MEQSESTPPSVKVLVWVPYLDHVGTVRAGINIAKGLSRLGHKVTLARAFREWEGLERTLESDQVELWDMRLRAVVPELPRHGLGYRISMVVLSVWALPRLWMAFWSGRFDALVACLGTTPALLAAFAIPPSRRPKIVISVQGLPKLTVLRRTLWRTLHLRADHIVALTERTRTLLANIAPANAAPRLTVVKNPVIEESEVSRLAMETPAPSLDIQAPFFVAIGRLTYQKDFCTLLRAFAIARQSRPDVSLVILGEGEDRAALESLVTKLAIGSHTFLPGYVHNVFPWIRQAAGLVLTSRWEDPGHVLMEAAFLRTPIIATDCPSGPRDFLADNRGGTLCPIGDAKAVGAAMLNLLALGPSNAGVATQVEFAYRAALEHTLAKAADHYGKILTSRALGAPEELRTQERHKNASAHA